MINIQPLLSVYIAEQTKRRNYSQTQNLLKSCCLTSSDRGPKKLKFKMETLCSPGGPSDLLMSPK